MDVGEDRVFIPVQILNDNLSEPTETFVVSIINVDTGSTLLFPRTARIDILDDENPVVDPPSPTANVELYRHAASRSFRLSKCTRWRLNLHRKIHH